LSHECTCGHRFLDAEDFRDHLPCPGTAQEQRIAELQRELADERNLTNALLAAVPELKHQIALTDALVEALPDQPATKALKAWIKARNDLVKELERRGQE
jgi:hypothetical protein